MKYSCHSGATGRRYMQTKTKSLVEVVISVFIGLGVALLTQIVVFLMFGLEVSFVQDLQIALIFTVVSVVRMYFVRRFFNWLERRNT